jgi:hypothetical protein
MKKKIRENKKIKVLGFVGHDPTLICPIEGRTQRHLMGFASHKTQPHIVVIVRS